MNTWFKKAKRRLYNCKALGDRSQHQLHYTLVKHWFRNNIKDVYTMPGEDTDSENNMLAVKICTKLNKIIQFWKGKPGWDLEKLYAKQQKVQNTLEGKLTAMECESGNVEVQWKNIKKCYLIGKVDRKTREQWITQEMIIQMDEWRKWTDVSKGVSWWHMWWDHGISKSSMLWFNVHIDEGSVLTRNPWDLKHWHWWL